ncbi:MAG TPA: efflux RND transporter permease subunit [Roseiflexaceae bacterium]|nr:efflux RND transporter permease subunit [Roseiflexaceae bacterium]
MMRWIVGASLQLRFLIVILAAVLMAFGISQLRSMPVDVYPEFNPPLVEVQTEALGLSADEVESLITTPMEADLLNGVAWLDQLYSESITGLSRILLVFEPGTDPIRARQMVQERLTQAHALPNVSKPPVMLQPLSSSSRVMIVGLSSKDLSPIEMGVLARWNIKPRLMGVPGVANVAVWGQRERQLQVLVDPQQLKAKGVTLHQVIETTGEALWVSPLSFLESSSPGTAGWIDTPNQRLGIRHLLPIVTPEDLAKVSVVESEGLLLGDVAKVVEDHQPLIGDAVVNNGTGLLLVIEKFPGANTLDVTQGVEAALEAMRPGLKGIEINSNIFRPANYLELALGNLAIVLLISAILVAVVLGAFLFHWRTALISLIAIPLSLVTAAFVLYLRGATFNALVLAGLAIAPGVVIDDAIVDVENIVRRLRQARQEGSDRTAAAIILEASLEMRGSLAFATLIVLLAVLPVFFIGGLSGAFFQPLAISYGLALLASLLVALIVMPALSLLLLARAPIERRQSPLVGRLQRGYSAFLARAIRTPRPAYLAIVVLVLLGLAVVPLLGQSLLPSFKQTDLLIQWQTAPGTSRSEMNRIAAQASQELRAVPGVRNVGTHVGRAETGDQIVGINSGEFWISLDSVANYDATVASIQEVIDGYPGIVRAVQAYQPSRLTEALTQPNQDIVVRVYGYDLPILREKAQEVTKALSEIGGVVEARADIQADEPQVEIQVDLAAAERYGLKPGDIRRTATTLLSGLHVGNLFEEQKVFDVVVWGTPEIRNSLSDIRELMIDTPSGEQVRLGEVADVRIMPAPTVIKRDTVSRFVDVGVKVSGRDLGLVTADIRQRLQQIPFPLEFHAEVLGVAAGRQAALQRVLAVVAVAVLGIFLLLQAAFQSWRLAAVTFVTLPTALVGGVLAAYAGGGMLSLGSLLGFFTLLGIAVRNGILLIKHYQHLEQQESASSGPELVVRGASERFVPILITALATALAFAPLVVFGDIPGLEMVYPMAVVILGGLVTSTVLNLFVIPALYLRFGASTAPDTSSRSMVAASSAAG